MRVVTYAIRGRTMFPPEVGLHAEDSLLEEWAKQLRETLAKLKADGVVGEDVELTGGYGQWLGRGARRHRMGRR